eukprot:4000119-Prymnesium_polylepis.1
MHSKDISRDVSTDPTMVTNTARAWYTWSLVCVARSACVQAAKTRCDMRQTGRTAGTNEQTDQKDTGERNVCVCYGPTGRGTRTGH